MWCSQLIHTKFWAVIVANEYLIARFSYNPIMAVILNWVWSSNIVTEKFYEQFFWNYSHVNVTEHLWLEVNMGSGNGLVPSGNKPLPEPMLTDLYVVI